MTEEKTYNTDQTSSNSSDWFQQFIHSIKVDELTYNTDTMEKNKRTMFDSMIANNHVQVARQARVMGSQIIIPTMLNEYFQTINSIFHQLKKLAFELSNSKILVWAEISENDESTEDILLLAEAKINGNFSNEGFRLLTTIVEDCDKIEVPKPYVNVDITTK
jgi:hypothetical protein